MDEAGANQAELPSMLMALPVNMAQKPRPRRPVDLAFIDLDAKNHTPKQTVSEP